MDYSREQIFGSGYYQTACDNLLRLAKDEKMKEKLIDILYDGKRGDFVLKSVFHCKDNPTLERNRRIAMASLLIQNPETYLFFEQNNINVFHGTNANALPNILKYGVCSHRYSEELGIKVITGEEWSRFGSREFISFTDILDIATNYASLDALDGEDFLSFGVVICTSKEKMENVRTVSVSSDISEIGVLNNLPIESISCICVPKDKIEFVKKMIGDRDIVVLAIDDISKKKYYVDDFNRIDIFTDSYFEGESSKKFSNSEIRGIAKSRSLFNMQKFLSKVKGIFVKSEEERHGRSFR